MNFFFPCFIKTAPYLTTKRQFVAKVSYCTLGILGFTFGLKMRCKAHTCKTFLSTDKIIRCVVLLKLLSEMLQLASEKLRYLCM